MISQVMAGPAQQPPQSGGPAAGERGTQPPPGPAPSPAPSSSLSQQQQAEVLYQAQLEQLAAMGFSDRQRNLTGTPVFPLCHLTTFLVPIPFLLLLLLFTSQL